MKILPKMNAVHFLLLFCINLLLPFLSDGIEPNIDKLKGEFDCFSSEVLNNKVVSDEGVYSDKGDEFYAIAPNNMNKNITFQININKYREDLLPDSEKQVDAIVERVPQKVESCENKTKKMFSHDCSTSEEDIKCKYLKTKDEMECNTTFTMTCEIDYKQIEGKQYGLLTFKIQRKYEEPCIVQFSTNEQNETITTNIQTSKSIYTSPPSIPSSTVIVSSKPTKKELSFSDCLTDIILIILVVVLILLLPIILFLIFYKPKPVKVVGKEEETTIVVEDGMTEQESVKTKQEKEHGKFMAVKTIAMESDQADSAEDLGQTGLTNIADNSEISERPEKVQHNEEEDKKSEARGVGTDTEQHNEEQRRSRDGVEVPETIIHTPTEHGGVEQGVEVPLYEEM
ncbi:unnamed protein product [Meloidogyne enterolobii]|uniref:Uncharacterized protein n=1 Tax=Meloidogyne enterolobii TaxID=390850 RepID=A0ACB1A109_MELEN